MAAVVTYSNVRRIGYQTYELEISTPPTATVTGSEYVHVRGSDIECLDLFLLREGTVVRTISGHCPSTHNAEMFKRMLIDVFERGPDNAFRQRLRAALYDSMIVKG